MLTMMQRTKMTPIGVDLGSASVQAIQLRRTRGMFSVLTQSQCDCHKNGSEDEGIDTEGRLVAMQACANQGQFIGKQARTALCPPDVEFHAIELPKAAMSQADQVVKFEVERLMTFDAGEVETRYWMLPPSYGTGANAIGMAAPVSIVTDAVQCCRSAGLECVAVDTIGGALACFGQTIRPVESGQIGSVLDIGAKHTRLVCCLGDTPILIRNVSLGSEDWTRLIAEALQIAPVSADVQKREHGILPSGRGVRSVGVDAQPHSRSVSSIIFSALRKSLHDLSMEIRRSYEYVLSCYPSAHASDMILVGGGALLTNLDIYLGDTLGIEVKLASDYLNRADCQLAYQPTKRTPLEKFALSIGLAIGGL